MLFTFQHLSIMNSSVQDLKVLVILLLIQDIRHMFDILVDCIADNCITVVLVALNSSEHQVPREFAFDCLDTLIE